MAREGAAVDNRTDLPDEQVVEAVRSYFVEQPSVLGSSPSTFQTYAARGSLLNAPGPAQDPGTPSRKTGATTCWADAHQIVFLARLPRPLG
jgi:hypothetical protein